MLFACFFASAALSAAAGLPIELVSSRPGLVFTEGEKVELALRVTGPTSRLSLDYRIMSLDGAVRLGGQVTIERVAAGAVETRVLPVVLPRPGLYRLEATARSGRRHVDLVRDLALIPEPAPATAESPWGVFFVPPLWYDKKNPNGPAEAAASIRRLGASWVRLGFWEHSLGDVRVDTEGGRKRVHMDTTLWQRYARALRAEGLHIMAGIAQVPRALSSQPRGETLAGDGGPLYGRVPPADYELWEQLVEQLAHDFRDTIDVWEIWNEPENQGVYFAGTREEFLTLVQHTSRALRRGNPEAKIAGCGFTSTFQGVGYAGLLLERGLAKELDILTVHYTEGDPASVPQWLGKLKEHGVTLPIWNTEERALLPLNDRVHGIPHTFKFLHVGFSYESEKPLVGKDYTLLPGGLAYATAAYALGAARFVKASEMPGGRLLLFSRGSDCVGVVQRIGAADPEPLPEAEFRFHVQLAPGVTSPTLSDLTGRREALPVTAEGEMTVRTGQPLVFVNGCTRLEPVSP